MSYKVMSTIRNSQGLVSRIIACAYNEQIPNADQWVQSNLWNFATSPGWADAWISFSLNYPGLTVDIGEIETVITDGMIISATQFIYASQQVPEVVPEPESEPVPENPEVPESEDEEDQPLIIP